VCTSGKSNYYHSKPTSPSKILLKFMEELYLYEYVEYLYEYVDFVGTQFQYKKDLFKI